MSTVVLDTGALIALERGEHAVWSWWRRAVDLERALVVPSAAVAQVWRGSPKQGRLSSALAMCEIDSFDGRVREIGVLCGRARTSDVCDAHVALVAAEVADFLYTSDPDDMRRLLDLCARRDVAIVQI